MAGTYKLKRAANKAAQRSARSDSASNYHGGRLASLDAFRGFIMILLAAHGFGVAHFVSLPQDAAAWKIADYATWQTIGEHFRHARWVTVNSTIGIAFWDLIQPAFMFMVGVAMPFSFSRRAAFGEPPSARTFHALIRAVVLVLMGVFLYSIGHTRTNWIFPNVLAQIGLGYFFVYLLLNRGQGTQLAAIAVILAGYWTFFFVNPPAQDYDYEAVNASVDEGEVFTDSMAPWSKNANAAFTFDQWLLPQLRTPIAEDVEGAVHDAGDDQAAEEDDAMPAEPKEVKLGVFRKWFFSNPEEYKFNRGGYTTLNFIPSIATALLGVLCGQLLVSGKRSATIIITLLVWGGICIGLGLVAHMTVCPIVKRIWTPSWALFSGGCVIWMLALFYVLFDAMPFQSVSWPLQVIGMNSLAVYFMGELLHGWIGENVIGVHLTGFLETFFPVGTLNDDMFGRIIQPSAVALIIWLICIWMYRQRIFVRV